MNVQDALITVRRYVPDEDGELDEVDTFAMTEVGNEYEVDLHISPRTDEVVTVSMSIENAWRLVRELATSAAVAEAQRDE